MALGTLFGIPIKATANIIPDSADDVSGASFSREHFIFVNEVSPRMDVDDSNKSARGGKELNGWAAYTYGTYRPAVGGVEILGDASTPTA